ncbi:nuclear transport factor 2 family protein [Streptomyces sp. NPDC047315]|uniref:YybH family protein n=1 Tax=Streptomyces sp. NPDC047315 TaxID=3155142 RepID=UPI00340C716F
MAETTDETDPTAGAVELGRRYLQAFNSGDVERLDRLYAQDAISVWEPGNPLTGRARRDSLAAFLALGPRMTAELREAFVTDDTALLVIDWSIEIDAAEDGGGGTERMAGTGVDVLRLGADGTWRFVVDNPFGGAGPGASTSE